MADRPSMKDGLSELFRRTDRGGAPSESGAQDAVVKGRPYVTTIKVVGIGGAGTNAINRMVDSGVKGVEFIAVNTDVQQLSVCDADVKIHIGQEITHGLGGGANPDVGREAMEVSRDQLKAALRGLELVARDLHGFAPDVGVRSAAETVRDLLPDVDLDVGVAHAELLHVGVDGDELDALDARVDHAVDRVRARAADADDLDGRHVGPSFDDRVLGAALARRATPVGAPEELAQSILHARTICHSAPPARGRGTIRPLCLWDRTSAPRPRSRAPRRT